MAAELNPDFKKPKILGRKGIVDEPSFSRQNKRPSKPFPESGKKFLRFGLKLLTDPADHQP